MHTGEPIFIKDENLNYDTVFTLTRTEKTEEGYLYVFVPLWDERYDVKIQIDGGSIRFVSKEPLPIYIGEKWWFLKAIDRR